MESQILFAKCCKNPLNTHHSKFLQYFWFKNALYSAFILKLINYIKLVLFMCVSHITIAWRKKNTETMENDSLEIGKCF